MKIELKSFKHAEFASHETHCYEATVYVDGKRAFYASNDGHGGADFYEPLHSIRKDPKEARSEFDVVMAKIEAHCATLPKWRSKFAIEDNMDVDIEILIGDIINKKLTAKELKKSLKKKVLFITEDGIYQTAYGQKKPADQNLIDMVREENPDALVLNSLAFDEALQIYTDWDLETYEKENKS
jgi:hypothetical protein